MQGAPVEKSREEREGSYRMGGFRGESREHHGRKFFAHFTRGTLSLPLEQPTGLFSPTTCRETEQRRVVSRGRKETGVTTGGERKPRVSQNLSLYWVPAPAATQ